MLCNFNYTQLHQLLIVEINLISDLKFIRCSRVDLKKSL